MSTNLHWTKTTPTTSRLFHHYLFCLLTFSIGSNIFRVSCVCSSLLYLPFISNTNLLLILLMHQNKIISRQCFLAFSDVLNVMLNIWHQNRNRIANQTHLSTLKLYTVFALLFCFFKTCFEEQYFSLSFLSVLFAISREQIRVVPLFYCFSYSRISFLCLYLVKLWLISFYSKLS